MKITLIVVFAFFMSMSLGYSQEKLEREYRIKNSQVPLNAIEFIENTFGNTKLKWYGEANLKGKSIEAKGYIKKKFYSIEFDTLGNLQDIEMIIDMKSLPENTKNKIKRELESRFSHLKIGKVQVQWIADASDIKLSTFGEIISATNVTNYEIIIKGKRDKKSSFYEVLFTKNGDLISESRIIEKNNHHLVY